MFFLLSLTDFLYRSGAGYCRAGLWRLRARGVEPQTGGPGSNRVLRRREGAGLGGPDSYINGHIT